MYLLEFSSSPNNKECYKYWLVLLLLYMMYIKDPLAIRGVSSYTRRFGEGREREKGREEKRNGGREGRERESEGEGGRCRERVREGAW